MGHIVEYIVFFVVSLGFLGILSWSAVGVLIAAVGVMMGQGKKE